MKTRVMIPALAVCLVYLVSASNAQAFGLLKLVGSHHGCGCEATCGCEPECGCEPACGCEPECGCEPACGCEPKCCKKRCGGLLNLKMKRMESCPYEKRDHRRGD